VQSRLPDPEWLEHWLDTPIRFDKEWETKVVERILHNLSLLFERTFNSVQDLNRYRKEVTTRVAAAAASAAATAAATAAQAFPASNNGERPAGNAA
jgi:hypothetical protein